MARRHHHEDHVNHEAWAIPYGDLVTLLLAFFVVMYAISSVNEGKYRVMADALASAFGGPPRTITPVTVGRNQLRGAAFDRPSMQTAAAKNGPAAASPVNVVRVRQVLDMPTFGRHVKAQREATKAEQAARREREQQLSSLGRDIQHALSELVKQRLVTVRRGRNYLEVEIQSDILFGSGVAVPSATATATVRKLGAVLRDQPNAVRVEGYTDDQPIHTAQFQSNWELSSARAASVVHVLMGEGVAPRRLAVVGFGEHQPIADNATAAGRNANRRVLLVILAAPDGPDAVPQSGPTIVLQPEESAPDTIAAVVGASPARPPAPSSSTSKPALRAAQAPARPQRADAGALAARTAPQPGAG